MKNFEKYKELIKNTDGDHCIEKGIYDACCRGKLIEDGQFLDKEQAIDWLCEEYKEPLSDEERAYLGRLIEPFRKYVKKITKYTYDNHEKICIYTATQLEEISYTYLPPFAKGTRFQNLEQDKDYTLLELEL